MDCHQVIALRVGDYKRERSIQPLVTSGLSSQSARRVLEGALSFHGLGTNTGEPVKTLSAAQQRPEP